MVVIGVDVGGSSIKAAPVDVTTGQLTETLHSVPTPDPSTADALVAAMKKLVAQFDVHGAVGFAFPAVIKHGTVYTAANIDRSLIGVDIQDLTARAIGRRALFLNDADAAGLAEMRFGAGIGCKGTVMVLTFGTGIGSSLFVDGQLLPNTELGHLECGGREAEHLASGRVRTAEGLSWQEWADRVNVVLRTYHAMLWPDLFILCGGVTEHYASFGHLLDGGTEIRPGRFRAHAGIVGAALAASRAGDR